MTYLTPRSRLSTSLSWDPETILRSPPPRSRHSWYSRIRQCPPDLVGIWGERIRHLGGEHRPIGRSRTRAKHLRQLTKKALRAHATAVAIETSNFPSTSSSSTNSIFSFSHPDFLTIHWCPRCMWHIWHSLLNLAKHSEIKKRLRSDVRTCLQMAQGRIIYANS